jgi:hypothetical protein
MRNNYLKQMNHSADKGMYFYLWRLASCALPQKHQIKDIVSPHQRRTTKLSYQDSTASIALQTVITKNIQFCCVAARRNLMIYLITICVPDAQISPKGMGELK